MPAPKSLCLELSIVVLHFYVLVDAEEHTSSRDPYISNPPFIVISGHAKSGLDLSLL